MRIVVFATVFLYFFVSTQIAFTQTIPKKIVAISTIIEVPQLLEVRDGVVEALAKRGFVDSDTITIDYQSANGNALTQQQIARKFVGEKADVIVSITTATSQAVATATTEIPIIFTAVVDPIAGRLISQYGKQSSNITGVSDAPPISDQITLLKKIVPSLARLGFAYNPGLDSTKAALAALRPVAQEAGIEIIEAAAPTTNEVIPAVRKLVGRVDAIYIPNDTTVVTAIEAIVKIGEEMKIPVFAAETRGVERGAIASVGLNYTEVGHLTGEMVADILDGKSVREIDAIIAYEAVAQIMMVINPEAAQRMGITIPGEIIEAATRIVDSRQ